MTQRLESIQLKQTTVFQNAVYGYDSLYIIYQDILITSEVHTFTYRLIHQK